MRRKTTPRAKAAPALALALGILCTCLFACLSCRNPVASSLSHSSGTSSLKLSMGVQASRSIGAKASPSIVPGNTDYLNAIKAYKVTVSNAGNTYTSTTVVSGVCTFTDIATGTYTVTVLAFSDAGATTQIAQGTTSATVTAGTTATASVTLAFTKAASTGGFSLNMAWPVSTGLAYAYATLDGTAIAVPAVTAGSTNYTATLVASNLSGVPHTLSIFFKASSSATTAIGPYIETLNIWDGVTDTMWADSSGALQNTLSLNPSEFASSDASLAGLSVATVGLGTTFSPATNAYGFGAALTLNAFYSFTVTADSATQGIACAFNGASLPLTATSATALSGSFQAASGLNTLSVTVTAADKKTVKTYVVSSGTPIMGGSYTASSFLSAVTTGGNYVLAGDVTISDSWTTPIGGSTTDYSGLFDGNGHRITMAGGSTDGLFYKVTGTVTNLNVNATMNAFGSDKSIIADFVGSGGTISNCSSSGKVTGAGEMAGIVGQALIGSTITHCTNTADITGSADNNGGVCAYCNGATIEYCVNTGNVTGVSYQIGGVVGWINSGSLSYSYNAGIVTGGNKYVGGVCGQITAGSMINCYNAGAVLAPSATEVGGLAGTVNAGCSVTNCYSSGSVSGSAPVGGFAGANSGTIVGCCYDSTASGQSDTGKGSPRTDMKSLTPYNLFGWSISTTLGSGTDWGIDFSSIINNGYPYLQVFGASTVSP